MQLCPQCNTNNRDTAHHCAQCGHGLQHLLGAGTILQGRYQIERVLGTGGFGAVYLVRHLALGHLFALKTSFDTTQGAVRQFEREAKFLVTLQHPNLARVTDFFIEANGTPYLVMEYVEGENLDELVTRTGLQPVSRVITWMEQTLDALHYLHTRIPAIVHRDIKPSNLILQADGRLVLVDFGIAKESGTKTTIGARAYTSGFSPPEQYGTQSTDARSDLYSVGATMFFLLTAQAPPDAIDRMVHGASLILPGSLLPGIAQLLTATLALNPSQRPTSTREFKAALTAPVAPAIPPPQCVAMPIPPTVRVSPPPSQRVKRLALLGGGAVIVAMIFLLLKLVAGSSPSHVIHQREPWMAPPVSNPPSGRLPVQQTTIVVAHIDTRQVTGQTVVPTTTDTPRVLEQTVMATSLAVINPVGATMLAAPIANAVVQPLTPTPSTNSVAPTPSTTPPIQSATPLSPITITSGQQVITVPHQAWGLWTAPIGDERIFERPRLYGGASVVYLAATSNAVSVRTPEGIEGWIHAPLAEALTTDLSLASAQTRFAPGTGIVIVWTRGIPLREQPNSSARKLRDQIKQGEHGTVSELRGDWLKVILDTGEIGWARWYYDGTSYIDVDH